MRTLALLVIVIGFIWPAGAYDLGTSCPAKPEPQGTPRPPDPDVLRQGGDTILSAVPIAIGASLNGTTAGYFNDYDEICPYSGSTAPDVVYTFVPNLNLAVVVDMYGSSYDTKIYIYDQNLDLVACNDDYYSDWTSRLDNVPVQAGVQYFLVIDGYGSASGVYTGFIEEFVPCVIDVPAGVPIEGEPPLVDGYLDAYNGGCNSPEFGNPFQAIATDVFFGRTGYYLDNSGAASRDTDWFVIESWYGGIDMLVEAEEACYVFELGPQDCGSVGVIQSVAIGPCESGYMSIPGNYGDTIWLWIGPQTFWSGETYEFDYFLMIPYPDAVEPRSWTAVKSLFD